MNSHKNARLTYQARRILVHRIIHEGLPIREAAKAQGVSPRTAYKGPTGRKGSSYTWKPDTKKLARFTRPGHRVTGDRRRALPGAGYEAVYVAVDAYSRLAYVEVKANERKESTVSFLLSALRHYRRLGVRIRAVMTDNAPMFRSRKFRRLLKRLGIRHRLTPPYTPRVNGKVERFLRTLLNEWAYAHAYASSEERNAHLPEWFHFYNWHRPHTSLKNRSPISRLGLRVNNVVRLHS